MSKIINFKSETRKTPFAPEWNYYLIEDYVMGVDLNNISKFLQKKKKDVLKLPVHSDGYTGLGETSTTARHRHFNVFSFKNKEIMKLKNKIILLHDVFLKTLKIPNQGSLYIGGWYNVMEKGQKIFPHLHDVSPYTYLGGHISIQCENTSTYYINPVNQLNEPEVYQSKNKNGKITLFQNCIPHYTDIHNSDTPRITIAFDIYKDKQYEHYIKLR
jgi:hypothetical protein